MRHGENEVRWQALHRAPPQQPTPSVVKPEGNPAASVKLGQESCVRSSGIITLSARGPSDSLGWGHNDDQSRRGHQCSETSLTGESRFHISTPLGIWTWVPCDGKETGSPLDQWDMVKMKWDGRLSTQGMFWESFQLNVLLTQSQIRKLNVFYDYTDINK